MVARPSRLEVKLLGPPVVAIDGTPVAVDTRKAIALLAYLAERETAPTRDELVWLLWPDSSPDRGRGALRRTISSLRSGLDGRWVEADRERVHLDRESLDLDTAALAAGRGLDDVRGRFLDGFYLRDAPEFDDWQATTAEHYDRLIRAGLEERIGSRLAEGDTSRAIADAERRLALDRLDESSHRLLMRTLALGGDRAGAIRQYRACVAILEEELAVEPLPETVELYESILAGALQPTHRSVPIPDPAPVPTVGLGELGLAPAADALRRAVALPGATAVVGPPGSGRTRLVTDALGGSVLIRTYASDGDTPHGLTRTILESLALESDTSLDERSAPAVHIAPLLARRSPEPPSLEGDLAGGRLLDGTVAAVATLAGDRVVVIDDAHLGDAASREVVARLVERASTLGLRLVITAESPVGDRSVAMPPMDASSVRGIAAALGHDATIAERVHKATGGWADAVLEALQSDEPLNTVAAQRRRRIESLDGTTRQALEALVVLGAGRVSTVAAVAGRPPDDVASALDRLHTVGLVSVGDGLHQPDPKWVGPAVTDAMGTAREALLHGRAADGLPDRPEHAAARARHLEWAGRSNEAAVVHEEAGLHAAGVLASDAARSHLETALALGHPHPGRIHRTLGEVETRAGNYAAAIRSYNAAAAEGTSWEIERAIGELYARWGRWTLAKAALEAALDLADGIPERATVLADLAVVAHRSGDEPAARARVEEALGAVNGTAEVAARVANVAGLVLDEPEHLLRAIAHARRTDAREDEAAALNNLALAYARRDRLDEGIALADRALALLDRTGDRHRRAAIHGNLADLHHQAGDEAASQAHLREAVTLFAEVGVGEWEPEIWKLTGW